MCVGHGAERTRLYALEIPKNHPKPCQAKNAGGTFFFEILNVGFSIHLGVVFARRPSGRRGNPLTNFNELHVYESESWIATVSCGALAMTASL